MISGIRPNQTVQKAAIWGICLAGGKSTRMGADKAAIRLQDGQTFLDRAFSLLSTLISPVFVSRRESRDYPGYPAIIDEMEGCGPAGGLAACLKRADANGASAILALACDLPAMTLPPLERLLLEFQAAPSLLACYIRPDTGKMEMGAAIWSVRALPFFSRALRKGALRLSAIVPGECASILPLPREWLPCFLNCNTPETLARFLG